MFRPEPPLKVFEVRVKIFTEEQFITLIALKKGEKKTVLSAEPRNCNIHFNLQQYTAKHLRRVKWFRE